MLVLCLVLQSAPGAAEGDPTQEPTGLPLTTLQRVGNAICKVPEGFNCHPDVSGCTLCSMAGQ
jgi:2-oxoglutarate dehydrogenase complex dehydrogenase (E1) component-like enzyme